MSAAPTTPRNENRHHIQRILLVWGVLSVILTPIVYFV